MTPLLITSHRLASLSQRTLPAAVLISTLGLIAAPASNSTDNPALATVRSVEAKIQLLTGPAPPGSRPTFDPIVITEQEANAYLKFHGREFLPPGVYSPEVHIRPGDVSGAADVDFNELNNSGPKTNDWGARFLAMVFRGRQHISAKGKVTTGNGQGHVTIQDVQVGSFEVPDWLVSLLVQNYVERRYNIDLSKPLALPDHVTHVDLGAGRATFYRQEQKNQK